MGVPAIREARHLATAARASGLPPPEAPEIALAGRSNVGKSSLLNALCRRRALARVSATPGKTRLLHLYEIDLDVRPAARREGGAEPPLLERLRLCDLPGYGWAKVSHRERDAWASMVTRYLVERPSLRGLVALVDARRGLGEADEKLLELAREARLPVQVVATKIDKLPKADRFPALQAMERSLAGRAGPVAPRPVGVSAAEGLGLAELWRALLWLAAGPARAVGALLLIALPLALLAWAPRAASAAEPRAAVEGERVVDRILYVVGADEVVTWTELQIEVRLRFLERVRTSGDAREAIKFDDPLGMELRRGDLSTAVDSVLAERLLWVEARRLRKERAPAEDVDADLRELIAMESVERWDRFHERWGATPEVIREIVARRVAISNFLYEHVYSRIKIGRDAALAYYDAHRGDHPGTFEEEEPAIQAILEATERARRRNETITALLKKHGVRTIAELP